MHGKLWRLRRRRKCSRVRHGSESLHGWRGRRSRHGIAGHLRCRRRRELRRRGGILRGREAFRSGAAAHGQLTDSGGVEDTGKLAWPGRRSGGRRGTCDGWGNEGRICGCSRRRRGGRCNGLAHGKGSECLRPSAGLGGARRRRRVQARRRLLPWLVEHLNQSRNANPRTGRCGLRKRLRRRGSEGIATGFGGFRGRRG